MRFSSEVKTMENRFGFIQNELDLKVLILYLLRHISLPVPKDDLLEVTLACDEGIGYFEFAECLSDLVRTQHIAEKEECYTVTAKGKANGEAAESSLPYSVRIRATAEAAALSQILSRDSMITTSHEMRQRGGFTVKLALSDGVGSVISMDVLCGDDSEAKTIEDNFRKNAEKLYGRIIELLLSEE